MPALALGQPITKCTLAILVGYSLVTTCLISPKVLRVRGVPVRDGRIHLHQHRVGAGRILHRQHCHPHHTEHHTVYAHATYHLFCCESRDVKCFTWKSAMDRDGKIVSASFLSHRLSHLFYSGGLLLCPGTPGTRPAHISKITREKKPLWSAWISLQQVNEFKRKRELTLHVTTYYYT